MGTLKDIANLTNLSMNTVSRVLRNSGYVSPETARKVNEAVKQIGYTPNRAARDLRNNRSSVIAVIAESADPMHIQKIAAIQQTAAQNGYVTNVFFVANNHPLSTLNAIIETVVGERVAGAIFIGLEKGLIAGAIRFREKLPCAIIHYQLVPELDSAAVDREAGVYEAVKYLYACGRRKIAFVGEDQRGSRLKGYQKAAAELGLKPLYFDALDTTGEEVRRSVRAAAGAIAQARGTVDALVSLDQHAAILAQELPHHGIRIPEGIAIIGFDNREYADLVDPALTTLAQPNAEIGSQTAQMLIERLKDPALAPRQLKIPMKLIVRNSTPDIKKG